MAVKKFDYLIIGNSAGGIGCVEGIRREDRDGSIAILADEKHHTYSRPLITHLLEGDVGRRGMDFRPRDFYRKHSVEPFLGVRARSLDLDKRSVRIEGGKGNGSGTLRFDKLLLATGGAPFIPPMDGSGLDGVTTMITLDQSLEVKKRLGRVRNAVVLGAGLIGTKTAEALSRVVDHVTMVELADRVLSLVSDETSSRLAADVFRKKGVEILLENSIIEIRGKGKVREVLLVDGTVLPCDLLVVAVGVRPRTEIAEGTGIRVDTTRTGGGFMVEDDMATNIEGVYACGDASHAHDFVTGAHRLLPLWPNAYIGGRIAGLNMAGVPSRHRWATNMNSVDFFGFPMVSAGFLEKPRRKGFREIIRDEKGKYARLVLKDDVIKGMVMAGYVARAGIYLGLMRNKVKTTSFSEHLLSHDFGAVHLPDEVKEKMKQPIRVIE